MDKYDRALLAALIDNGRLTFAELARRINLSPRRWPTGWPSWRPKGDYRLPRLGEPGQARPAHRVRDRTADHREGLPVGARRTGPDPQLTLCHRITGDACVLMKAAVASMPELQDLIDRLMKFGISKTSMILSTPSPTASRQPAGQDGNGGCGVSPAPGLSGRRRIRPFIAATNPNRRAPAKGGPVRTAPPKSRSCIVERQGRSPY